LDWVAPLSYPMQLTTLMTGCVLLGLGVSLEVIANVVMLSGEAFVNAYANKRQRSFGSTKILFDTTLMLLACITSLFLFFNITGVREGTIIAALTVGLFARFFHKKLSFLQTYLAN
ncbi:MAG: YitT family protein, partial [Bacteroidales bacterium]